MEEHSVGRSAELEIEDLHQDRGPSSFSGTWLCCMPCYWLQRNNRVEKTMLTVATLLVSVLLVASPVIFLMSNAPADRSSSCTQDCWVLRRKNCNEEQCIAAQDRILAALATGSHPCKDWYTFVDGGSQKPFMNFQDRLTRDIKHELAVAANFQPFQKLAAFFKSCLRVEDRKITYTPMTALLKDLGGYVAPDSVPPCDLTTLLYRLIRIGASPMFQVAQQQDASNSSVYIPVIDAPRQNPGWTNRPFKSTTSFKNQEESSQENVLRKREQSRVSEVRMLVMAEILKEIMPEDLPEIVKSKEINASLLFSSQLLKLQQSRSALEANTLESISVLQERCSIVQWCQFFQLVFQTEFSPDRKVHTLSPQYVNDVNQFLKQFEARVIHNGLLLIFATDVLYPLVNSSVHEDWPSFCAQSMAQLFQEPILSILIKKYTNQEWIDIQSKLKNLMLEMKNIVTSRLVNVSWLDEKSRKELRSKMMKLEMKMEPVEGYHNFTEMGHQLDLLRVDPDDFLANTIRRLAQFPPITIDESEVLGREVIPKEWGALRWRPYYLPSKDILVIPVGLLLHPSFRSTLPRYMGYSTVGQIVASALLNTLIKYKGADWSAGGGNLPHQLIERLRCRGRPLLEIHEEDGDEKELMSAVIEASAVDVAYEAWARDDNSLYEPAIPNVNFNNNQLFFILATQGYEWQDSHAANTPGHQRINSMMMNSEHFSVAFECSQHSLMNPKNKCSLWKGHMIVD